MFDCYDNQSAQRNRDVIVVSMSWNFVFMLCGSCGCSVVVLVVVPVVTFVVIVVLCCGSVFYSGSVFNLGCRFCWSYRSWIREMMMLWLRHC